MSYLGPSKRRYIDKYSYLGSNVLGQGYSGTVYLGRHQPTGDMCAIKIIQKSILKYQAHKSMILCQIQFLNILKGSQKILTIYEVYKTKNNIYLVLQLCSTDLKEYLTLKKVIPEAQAIDIMKSIIMGYKAIWKANIVHRDLKPSNILLKDEQVKIADFGFSMFQKDKKEYEKINVGSPYYMPPQVLGNNTYSYQSDIWALGIIFFEMLMGRNPWKAKTEKQLFQELKGFDVLDVLPQGLSQISRQFLRKSLTIDPAKRMKPEELVSFQFQQFSQSNSVDMRNSTRMQQTLHLQKNHSRKTRTLHDPQKHSTMKINTTQDKQNNLNKNPSDQIQTQDMDIGSSNHENINNLAQSRMKKQNKQQNLDEVEQLPSLNKKKKVIHRKTSLQVNYEPFQGEKVIGRQSPVAKGVSSSNPELSGKGKIEEVPESKGDKVQVSNRCSQEQLQGTQLMPKKQNQITADKRKTQFEAMRTFSKILRSQIHFCRYLYKLLKRVLDHLPNQLNLVKAEFKQQMATFIFVKLRKIQKQKIPDPQVMKGWLQTKQWEKIKSVIAQYKLKYKAGLQQLKVPKQFNRQLFGDLLRKSILQLYKRAYNAYISEEDRLSKQPKTKLKREQPTQTQHQDQSQIMKIKEEIIILDYLITLKQLIRLQQKHGWDGFQKRSKIQSIVQGDPLKYIQQKHILAISQKLQTLRIL